MRIGDIAMLGEMALGFLFTKAGEVGWEKARDLYLDMLDKQDSAHPVQKYIEEMRRTKGSAIFPDDKMELLSSALNNAPVVREFKAAMERLLIETLDEVEEDPATREFEKRLVHHINRFQRRIVEEPALERLMLAAGMSRKDARKIKKGK